MSAMAKIRTGGKITAKAWTHRHKRKKRSRGRQRQNMTATTTRKTIFGNNELNQCFLEQIVTLGQKGIFGEAATKKANELTRKYARERSIGWKAPKERKTG